MARRRITQIEARRLHKEVNALKQLVRDYRNAWGKTWPEGTMIGEIQPTAELKASVRTARALRHAVSVQEHQGQLYFYASPVAEV